MADFLEVLMLICFGVSWPLNIVKAWKARTAKGTSVLFYFFIVIGYLCGLGSKMIKLSAGIETPIYVWFFYCLNTLIVTCGILIYFRNRIYDHKAAKKAAQ